MLVGEIGISRREFLYDIRLWEVQRILNGYSRRHSQMWSAVRWHAYNIMAAMPYCDLNKAGVFKPQDLIQFPWDIEDADAPSDEEVNDMQSMIDDINKEAGS